MPSEKKSLTDSLDLILSSAATPEETENLKELGIKVRRPTKLTVVLAALYKKAAAGDLSAIKELRSIVSEKIEDKPIGAKAVMIVDDIRD